MLKNIAGIILAAGSSRRMGSTNKLTRIWNGKPLVRHVVDAALVSNLTSVTMVTGHDVEAISQLLPTSIETVHNTDHQTGMAGSLRTGVNAAPNAAGLMILLGDMPLVSSDHINAMIDVFECGNGKGKSIIQACADGKTGNPVLFSKVYIPDLINIDGDRGAKWVIDANPDHVVLVEIGAAAVRDFDTPAAF